MTLNTKKASGRVPTRASPPRILPYDPVAIDAGEVYLSDLVAGVASSKGIKFNL